MTTPSSVRGLHHLTAMAGDPQDNVRFYTEVMGLRLVKRSVNQDAPNVYHLFYADAEGNPGTDLTFFPQPSLPRGTTGAGQIVEVMMAVPEGSLDYWAERLDEHGVERGDVTTRFGEKALPVRDPDGMRLSLVETEAPMDVTLWPESPVPEAHQLRGMHGIRMLERKLEPTSTLLTEKMGLEKVVSEDGWTRFGLDGGRSGTIADVHVDPDAPAGRGGAGVVHHAAWRTPTDDDQDAMRAAVQEMGVRPTQQIDRFWFRSVYFREPGGVLFELATDDPGFTADESLDALGETLILPPWLEERRSQIENALPPLDTTPSA